MEFQETLSLPGNSEVEKEHMFDKVVTPSDVGKLNRLVIPKQHAEKHFPLDPSFGDKGLSLCFEDSGGKQWRFRYSYWTSSQSYVMTKGWSRFVKEKRLDAGDTVTFQRGLREAHRHRLFITFRRRPELPQNPSLMSFARSVLPWTGFLPSSSSSFPSHDQFWYLRSPSFPPQIPLVLNSVPVIPKRVEAKRVRLFGVNLDSRVKEEGRLESDLRLTLGNTQISNSQSKDKNMSLELKM